MSEPLDEEAIFQLARKISDPDDRATYLDQICAGDQGLRERVEELLEAHENESELLKSSPGDIATTDTSPVTEKVGQRIGRYKLLQKIGEGGFGVVYMAEQARPVRRRVALKIIKPGMDTDAVVARFEAERQALALMDHPNIARVLDGGATDSGRPYFVMELVKGVQIMEYCDRNRLPIRERLQLLATICHAVQHAHQKGIIHRDLKPSNVLITLHDGKPVIKVIDFGVSKAINQQLTEKTLFTVYGQMIGTPQYMSPEQAEMSGLDVDTRTDVYSLGVLMYELLTGTTPLNAEKLRNTAFVDLQKIIRGEDAPKPSLRLSSMGATATQIADLRKIDVLQLRQFVSGDLDWIAMKCLEKERNRRYGTPVDLADDIERFLKDEPIEARPPSKSYLFHKFVRRNRFMVGAAGAIGLSLLLGLVVSSIGLLQARAATQTAERERRKAEIAMNAEKQERIAADQAKNEAETERKGRERDLYFSEMSLAYRLWDENNYLRAADILEKYAGPEFAGDRGIEWSFLRRATERRRIARVIPFDDVPGEIGFTQDGTGVCVAGWDGAITLSQVAVNSDRTVIVPREIGWQQTHPYGIGFGQFLGDGHSVVSTVGYWRNGKAILRALANAPDRELDGVRPYSRFTFDEANRRVAAMGEDNSILVFDLDDGRLITRIPANATFGQAIALSRNGGLMAVAHSDRVAVWDTTSAMLVRDLRLGDDATKEVNELEFSPDNTLLAAGLEAREVTAIIWRTTDWERWKEIVDHDDAVRAVAFSPDSKILATGSRDNTIKLRDTASLAPRETLKGHSGIVNDVAFSPDGSLLASASQDYHVVIWDLEARSAIRRFQPLGEMDDVSTIGDRVIYLTEGRIYELDPIAGGQSSARVFPERRIDRLVGSANGEMAIAHDSAVEIWDRGIKQDSITAGAKVTVMAFSESTQRLALGYDDGRVACSDRDAGTLTESLNLHPVSVNVVVFNPDETCIASGAGVFGGQGDSDVLVWSIQNKSVRRFSGHRDGINSLLFLPDGEQLISGSEDNEIRIWNVSNGPSTSRRLLGHTASVYSVLLDSQQRLLSAGGDRTIRFWDLSTGLQCGLINVGLNTKQVHSLQFTNSETTLVAASDANMILVWDVTSNSREP